jgi:hypothetical protein
VRRIVPRLLGEHGGDLTPIAALRDGLAGAAGAAARRLSSGLAMPKTTSAAISNAERLRASIDTHPASHHFGPLAAASSAISRTCGC